VKKTVIIGIVIAIIIAIGGVYAISIAPDIAPVDETGLGLEDLVESTVEEEQPPVEETPEEAGIGFEDLAEGTVEEPEEEEEEEIVDEVDIIVEEEFGFGG